MVMHSKTCCKPVFVKEKELILFHLLLKEKTTHSVWRSVIFSVFVYYTADICSCLCEKMKRVVPCTGNETVRFTIVFSSCTILFHRLFCPNTRHRCFSQQLWNIREKTAFLFPELKINLGISNISLTCRLLHVTLGGTDKAGKDKYHCV